MDIPPLPQPAETVQEGDGAKLAAALAAVLGDISIVPQRHSLLLVVGPSGT